jgi:hypothetical protein
VVIDGGVDVALMDHLDKYPDATIDEKRGATRAILAKSMGVRVDPETSQEVAEVVMVDDPDTPPPAWLEDR